MKRFRGKLLSVGQDAKTIKGNDRGVITAILYLAPHKSSGVMNVCSHASPQCIALCLNESGNGFYPSVQESRIRKTRMFKQNRSQFWKELMSDLDKFDDYVDEQSKLDGIKYEKAVRLNGTSDLPWESIPVVVDGEYLAGSITWLYFWMTFYGYTKNPDRVEKAKGHPFHHLTFSRSELNEAEALQHVEDGGTTAVVFSTKKDEDLPPEYMGLPVIDGDSDDIRYRDPEGVIIGLRAKGRACNKELIGGFVVDVSKLEEVAVCS